MKKLLTLISALALVIQIQAQTVVDVIVNSPDHTTLETAVVEAGLVSTLQGAGPFTVFAPTDAAFAALPAGLLDQLLADPAGDLTQILLYHVVAAEALSTSLSNGQIITTVQGQDVTVNITNGNVFINEAQVTVADVPASNGVVHVINAVLVPNLNPLPATVVDIIVNSPDHTTLEAAVGAAGLVETLQGAGPFTVFAPTDAAFAALPAGLIDELLADPTGDLTQILLYHVVAGEALSTSLSDGQIITTVQGQTVTIDIMGGNVFVNNAQVIVADLQAENGVVHVINAVLLPDLTVSVTENEELNIQLYPNPAADQITVNTGGLENATYQIIDQTGRVVGAGNIGLQNTIGVADLASGIYSFRLNQNGRVSSTPFMKK